MFSSSGQKTMGRSGQERGMQVFFQCFLQAAVYYGDGQYRAAGRSGLFGRGATAVQACSRDASCLAREGMTVRALALHVTGLLFALLMPSHW